MRVRSAHGPQPVAILISLAFCLALGLSSWLVASAGQPWGTPQPAELILGHISDQHITSSAPNDTSFSALVDVLEFITGFDPGVVISTGDLTDVNETYAYRQYKEALRGVGGFDHFPEYSKGIVFRPVAGNHDYFGIEPWPIEMGPVNHSFVVGNYRFIGFSGDTARGAPLAWLEAEMQRSCDDQRPIILYHHYPLPGWHDPENGDMSPQVWAALASLMQRYPVIAYLAGHNHQDRLAILAPGFMAHTVARTALGYSTLYALRDGTLNYRHVRTRPMRLLLTYPHQYLEGLEYTKTRAEPLMVRAYAATTGGQVSGVYYRVDNGPAVAMQRVGTTDYYEGALDASGMSGPHTVAVTATHSAGQWADDGYSTEVYFAGSVPRREAPGCECLSRTMTVPLSAGWNLVSVPLSTGSSAPRDIFASIQGGYDIAYAYDGRYADAPWKGYSPAAPAGANDLTRLVAGQGFWLHVERDTTWTVTGTVPSTISATLTVGWNLVGYAGKTWEPLTRTLASLVGACDLVGGYEAAENAHPWRWYDPAAPAILNSLSAMEPGKGYWVHVTQERVWHVP